MNEWKLQVVLPDGGVRNTRFKGMDLDTAEEIMEGVWMGTDPNGNAIGLQVVSERTGRVYSELEW
jgi:hypothetical protein